MKNEEDLTPSQAIFSLLEQLKTLYLRQGSQTGYVILEEDDLVLLKESLRLMVVDTRFEKIYLREQRDGETTWYDIDPVKLIKQLGRGQRLNKHTMYQMALNCKQGQLPEDEAKYIGRAVEKANEGPYEQ